MRKCAICGESLLCLDGRYKYCSDECAIEAHRRQCRERARRCYWADPQKYRAINQANYRKQKNRRAKAEA